MIHDDAVYVFSAFSCILAGVPCHFHHVCVGVLANHLHQAHEPPEGGECVWLRRLVIVGRDEEAWCGSADVGYSLAAWLNAAFRLIILSSESAWSCTVMAVILTTALLLCSPNGHTCTDLKKKKKEPPLHISSNCGEACTQSIIHMKAFLYETWSMDHLRFFRL